MSDHVEIDGVRYEVAEALGHVKAALLRVPPGDVVVFPRNGINRIPWLFKLSNRREALTTDGLAVLVDALEQSLLDAARWRAFAKTASVKRDGGLQWISSSIMYHYHERPLPTPDEYADALIANQAIEWPNV